MTTEGHQGYVCCEPVASEPEKLPPGHQGTPYQDTCWHFSKEPERYVDSAEVHYYYLSALRNGEVIAATPETAAYAGLKFVAYDEVLEVEQVKAAAKYKAATGRALPDTDPFARPKPADSTSPSDLARAASDKAFAESNPTLARELLQAAAKLAADKLASAS